jgi:hypothetical protein
MKFPPMAAAVLVIVGTSGLNQSMQAAPGNNSNTSWNASRIQAESLVAAHRPNEAAAATIQALQGMQKSPVTDKDPNARKLIVEDLPDIVTGLIVERKDYNNAETLCKWAISACTARFGTTSPLTAISYSPLVTVYSVYGNTISNRDQKKKDTLSKREQIRTSMTLAQQSEFLKLTLSSAQHSAHQMDVQTQDLQAAQDRLGQSMKRLENTLNQIKKP